MTARAYGWRRDLPDHRDVPIVHLGAHATGPLPDHVDLRPFCPPAYDQAQLGSCTANAGAGAYEFAVLHQHQVDFTPSRLALYYHTRAREGTTAYDAGAYLRDTCKVLSHQGVASEQLWPYDVTRYATRPPRSVDKAALKHRAVSYARVPQTHDDLRRTLAAGMPIMFGFSVYESFESSETADAGVVSMPALHESMLGGHAVLAVGYSDVAKRYIVRNSWGKGWGADGYCYMPYAYVEDPDLASDFWVIREVL